MWDAEFMPPSVEESARQFRERGLRARAERERRAAEIRTEVESQLRALLPSGARAWLIGSLVWGGFGERSDVDVVLSGVSAAEETRIEDAVARVARVDVDLLDFDKLPASFQRRIEQEGILIRGR
jgi:predicted nucleotidyltransferase